MGHARRVTGGGGADHGIAMHGPQTVGDVDLHEPTRLPGVGQGLEQPFNIVSIVHVAVHVEIGAPQPAQTLEPLEGATKTESE